MRAQIKDRFYRTHMYQDVDRVPDIEFGYWPQTICRWLKEGLPLKLTPEETEEMFLKKLDDFFGFDRGGYRVKTVLDPIPAFVEEVLERREQSVTKRDLYGVVAERYLHDSDASSMPRFISFLSRRRRTGRR